MIETESKRGGLRLQGIKKADILGQPLVSIVTVVLNGEAHLRQTIESILNQTYPNIEYIILDGGSTDGTLAIIHEYEDRLDYWQSETDAGIYDAMNKGTRLCTGSLIGIKNADDWYTPTAIADVARIWQKTNADVVYGNTYRVWQENPLRTSLFISDSKRIWKNGGIDHRTVFATKEIYQTYIYDTQYKICADFDWMVRLKKNRKFFMHAKQVLAFKRPGGASATALTEQEFYQIHKKHYGAFEANWVWIQNKAWLMLLKMGNVVLKALLGKKGFASFKSRKKK